MKIKFATVMCADVLDAFFGRSTNSGVISRNVRMGYENGHRKLGFQGEERVQTIYGCVFGRVGSGGVYEVGGKVI